MATATPTLISDKRTAILTATCDLIAEKGLHNTPMSAIARKANVAAGTLYLYFENKDILLNEVFLHLKRECLAYIEQETHQVDALEERLRLRWMAIAQWHLDFPQAFKFIQQCEISGILSDATLQQQEELEAPLLNEFHEAVETGLLKDLSRQVMFALLMGPIIILAHLQTKGEIEITEALLTHTYAQIQHGIQP